MNQPYLKRLIEHLIDSSISKGNQISADSTQMDQGITNFTNPTKNRTPLGILNFHPQNNHTQLHSNCLHLSTNNPVQHQNYIQTKIQQAQQFLKHKKNSDKVLFEFEIIVDIGDGRGDSIMINQDSEPFLQARLFCQKHGLDEYIANILGNSFSEQKQYQKTLAEREQMLSQNAQNQGQKSCKKKVSYGNNTHSNFSNEDLDSDIRKLQESIQRNNKQNHKQELRIISKTLDIKPQTHNQIYVSNSESVQQKNIGAEKLLSKKKHRKISQQQIAAVNRLYQPKINKNIKISSNNSQQVIFHPTMNEISREIINKVGKDQIITNKMTKTKQKISKLKMQSQNSINQDLKQCHFKPKINKISVKVDQQKNSRALDRLSDNPNSGINVLENSLKQHFLLPIKEDKHELQVNINVQYEKLDFKITSGQNSTSKQNWLMTQNKEKKIQSNAKYSKTQQKNVNSLSQQCNLNCIQSSENPNLFFLVNIKKNTKQKSVKATSHQKSKIYSNSKEKIKDKSDNNLSTSKKVNTSTRYEKLYRNAKDIANKKQRLRKNSIDSISFKPKINDISRRIIQKSTEKGTNSAYKNKRNSHAELKTNLQSLGNIVYSGLFPQQQKQKICQLEKSYVESQFIKNKNKTVLNRSLDNFYHNKKNMMYNENRNSKQLPIGDYLYEQAMLVQKKKDKIRQKQLEIQRGPQILEHSEQIVNNLRQNALRQIFRLLKLKTLHQTHNLKFEDLDWVSMTQRQLLFIPLFQQMKQMQVQLSEQEFVLAGMKLISYLSQKEKNLLIETVHKHHQQKKEHKMSISSKSQALIKDKSLYQQYDVYTRGLIHKKSVKQQVQRGRQQRVRDQLKDCTFKPIINKQIIQA